MKKRPARSLFDEQYRDQALEKINDVLPRLSRMVDWESFRALIESHFPVREPCKGGQPPYDRLMLFKAVVLMELYGLSAEALEYQINDRRSFQRFLGLEPQHQVPDSTTVRLFVEHLTRAKAMEGLFVAYHARLSTAGLVVNEGKIIDASMVHAPIQHNKREDRELLENGELPANWSSRKKAQKDLDATWAKKNSKSYHGYKNHVKVDAGSKLIDHYVVTTASVTDGEMAWDLLDERDQGQDLYADKGYDWEDVKDGITLAKIERPHPQEGAPQQAAHRARGGTQQGAEPDARPHRTCVRQHEQATARTERPLHRPQACHLPRRLDQSVLQSASLTSPDTDILRGERVT